MTNFQRAWIDDELRNHRRDEQIDAAGWDDDDESAMACHDCGRIIPMSLGNYCNTCWARRTTKRNDA